jgi:D-alanine-D-alanine ligase-like ATP-grasp enzyme
LSWHATVFSYYPFVVKEVPTANMLPAITPTRVLPRAAAEVGYSFEGLIAVLIEAVFEDTRRR